MQKPKQQQQTFNGFPNRWILCQNNCVKNLRRKISVQFRTKPLLMMKSKGGSSTKKKTKRNRRTRSRIFFTGLNCMVCILVLNASNIHFQLIPAKWCCCYNEKVLHTLKCSFIACVVLCFCIVYSHPITILQQAHYSQFHTLTLHSLYECYKFALIFHLDRSRYRH